jgi:hypothetical protein
MFTFYFPQEFPTFLLACKRYFGIQNQAYDLLIRYSFVGLRFFIILWFLINIKILLKRVGYI